MIVITLPEALAVMPAAVSFAARSWATLALVSGVPPPVFTRWVTAVPAAVTLQVSPLTRVSTVTVRVVAAWFASEAGASCRLEAVIAVPSTDTIVTTPPVELARNEENAGEAFTAEARPLATLASVEAVAVKLTVPIGVAAIDQVSPTWTVPVGVNCTERVPGAVAMAPEVWTANVAEKVVPAVSRIVTSDPETWAWKFAWPSIWPSSSAAIDEAVSTPATVWVAVRRVVFEVFSSVIDQVSPTLALPESARLWID